MYGSESVGDCILSAHPRFLLARYSRLGTLAMAVPVSSWRAVILPQHSDALGDERQEMALVPPLKLREPPVLAGDPPATDAPVSSGRWVIRMSGLTRRMTSAISFTLFRSK